MTNLRAVVTMGLAIWTGFRYMAQPKWGVWEPSIEWLGFLLALSGWDVAQFAVKRRTHIPTNGDADVAPSGAAAERTP